MGNSRALRGSQYQRWGDIQQETGTQRIPHLSSPSKSLMLPIKVISVPSGHDIQDAIQSRAPRPGPPGELVSCPQLGLEVMPRLGGIRGSQGRYPELPSLEHKLNRFGWGVCVLGGGEFGGFGGRLQNTEIRAVLTTEGRGGERVNSQPPAEVLSGSSCVPPDSWHDGGSASTSCAQLSPWPHSASPAVPSPAAGLLNW